MNERKIIFGRLVLLYSQLLQANPEVFFQCLYDGSITIAEAVSSYISLSEDEKEKNSNAIYYILSAAKKLDYKNYKHLSKLFDNDIEFAFEILKNKHIYFDFPVVSNNSFGKLINGFVVRTSKIRTNMVSTLTYLKKISRITGKNFSVFFDDHFMDDSFMLSVYVALETGRYEKGLSFTGGIDDEGRLKLASNLEIKEKVCSKKGKILISKIDIENLQDITDFLNSKVHDVPVFLSYLRKYEPEYIEKSFDELKRSIENATDTELFTKILGEKLINMKDFIGDDDWLEEIKNIKYLLNKIVVKNGIPHIAIAGPAVLAMGAGIAFGCQNPVVLYHNQGGKYYKVIDLRENIRSIKEIRDVSNLKKLEFEEEGNGENCAFVVQLASHAPNADTVNFLRMNNINAKVVHIFHKNAGNLEPKNWEFEVSELMSIVQHYRRKEHFERFLFFFSIPVPVAFAFGMALGPFCKGSVYSFVRETNSYIEAFRIEDINV